MRRPRASWRVERPALNVVVRSSERKRQRSITQLVESAAVGSVVAATAFRSYLLRERLDVGCLEALQHDVVAVQQLPDRSAVATRGAGYDRLGHIAVRVRCIGTILAQIVPSGILRAPQYAIILIAEQVVSLIPGCLTDHPQQSDVEQGMPLIAPTLLNLAKPTVVNCADQAFRIVTALSAYASSPDIFHRRPS